MRSEKWEGGIFGSMEKQAPYAPSRPRIYSHLTGRRFLHLEDALERGKIRVFVGEYSKGQGMKSSAFHFLDVDDARVVFSDLAWGRFVQYQEFKGGPSTPLRTGSDGAGKTTSRVLKINVSEGKVWFQVQNGPGEKLGAGAVKPVGKAEAEVVVPFEIWDARKMAFALLAYLQAWEVGRVMSGK